MSEITISPEIAVEALKWYVSRELKEVLLRGRELYESQGDVPVVTVNRSGTFWHELTQNEGSVDPRVVGQVEIARGRMFKASPVDANDYHGENNSLIADLPELLPDLFASVLVASRGADSFQSQYDIYEGEAWEPFKALVEDALPSFEDVVGQHPEGEIIVVDDTAGSEMTMAGLIPAMFAAAYERMHGVQVDYESLESNLFGYNPETQEWPELKMGNLTLRRFVLLDKTRRDALNWKEVVRGGMAGGEWVEQLIDTGLLPVGERENRDYADDPLLAYQMGLLTGEYRGEGMKLYTISKTGEGVNEMTAEEMGRECVKRYLDGKGYVKGTVDEINPHNFYNYLSQNQIEQMRERFRDELNS